MNELIRELAEQCWDQRLDGQLHFDTEHFAFLIVQECMSYMKDGDIDFAKFMIKKHFGVQE